LIAPWIDFNNKYNGFQQNEIQSDIEDRVNSINIIVSKNDTVNGVIKSAELIHKTFKKSKIHTFENYGHFSFGEMRTDKFPELLEVIISS